MSTASSTVDIEDAFEALHTAACRAEERSYQDPTTGFTVFTEYFHLKRGTCCGNSCRHCPYGWANVKSGNRKLALVESGNKVQVQARLAEVMNGTDSASGGGESVETASADDDLLSDTGYFAQEEKKEEVVLPSPAEKKKSKKNVPYTRTGDAGTSSLLTGERRSKTDQAFHAMGTIDELCSQVGVVHAMIAADSKDRDNVSELQAELLEWLLDIMSRLFDIGSHVAKPPRRRDEEDDSFDFVANGVGDGFDVHHVELLETWVDTLTEDLPELRSFILPTGTVTSAQFHVARTVCRRAERTVVPLVHGERTVCDPNALRYLNRLSDFFFVAARWVNLRLGDDSDEVQYRRATRGSKQRSRMVNND